MRFKVRFGRECGNPADAEVSDRRYMVGNGQQAFQCLRLDDADPADADAFGACRQPEILHRADRAVEVHLRIVPTSQWRALRALAVAGDADVERAFADAFQLQLAVKRLPFFLDFGQFLFSRGEEQIAHLLPSRGIADDDEIPRLHEPDRRRVMGGKQQPRQHLIVERSRQEMTAHIAPREHGTVDRVARHLVKSVADRSGHSIRHRLSPCDCKPCPPPDHADDGACQAGLLARDQPASGAFPSSTVAFTGAVPLTALGTPRNSTVFPILPPEHLQPSGITWRRRMRLDKQTGGHQAVTATLCRSVRGANPHSDANGRRSDFPQPSGRDAWPSRRWGTR